MVKMILVMFCSLFEPVKKEVPLDPLIARLDLPAKLPSSYTYDQKQKAVAKLILSWMNSKQISRINTRTVRGVCEYYGVNLHGTGIFKRDSRNHKMLCVC